MKLRKLGGLDSLGSLGAGLRLHLRLRLRLWGTATSTATAMAVGYSYIYGYGYDCGVSRQVVMGEEFGSSGAGWSRF